MVNAAKRIAALAEPSASNVGSPTPARQRPLRGFPVPAAMNRLARAHGLGVAADDAALTAEFGAKPHRESIQMLAEELGADFQFVKKPLTSLRSEELPVIALTKTGGAVIIRGLSEQNATIETPDGPTTLSIDALVAACAGIVLTFRLNAASAARLASTQTAHANAQQSTNATPQEKAPDMTRWLAEIVLRRNRPEMAQLLTASLLSNLFLIALPLFIMSVYDRVIPHTAFESLITLTVGVLIILSADLGIRFARLKFTDAVGLKIARRLQTSLYRRLLFISLARRPKSAAVINNVAQEIEAICLLTPEFMVAAVSDTLLAIFILSLIAYIGGGIVIAPIIGLLAVAAAVFFGAWSSKNHAQQATVLRSAGANQIAETFESLTAVKAAGAEHALLSRYERIAGATGLKGHHARQRGRFATQAAGVIVQATVVGALVLGVVRIDAGLMSIGSLAATTILVGRAVMPVSQLVDQFCRLWTLRDVLNGAAVLLSEPEEKGGEGDGSEGRAFKGSISLRDVGYRHDQSGVAALQGVTLDIAPGEKIGLIGKNGSGKSTFLHLLPKLYEPSEGVILVDDADSRQYAARRLRQHMALMPQETVLFNQSLRDNILLGAEDVDDDAFEQAVALSGVDRFAKAHPQGYSMEVGPRGEFLSAGERQAVGLARALLKPRNILLLDEPTSLMDHTAEAHVISALKGHVSSKTLIVSTHRLRILELVDRVIVLDRGRVLKDGPRDAVLASMAQEKPPAQQKTATKRAS